MASSSCALDCCASSETSLKGESFSLDKMLDIFNPKKGGEKISNKNSQYFNWSLATIKDTDW